MKGAIAVFLDLIENYARSDNPPDVGLLLSANYGGLTSEDLFLNPRFVIAGEPTNLDVAVKEKGLLRFRVAEKGVSAHSATPYRGVNAIELLYTKLSGLRRKYDKANMGNFWLPTFNWGLCRAGDAPNRVPDHAEAEIEIRYTENESREDIINTIEGLFPEYEITFDGPMIRTGPNQHVETLEEQRKNVTGTSSKNDYSISYSNCSSYLRDFTPIAIFGPKGENPHGPDEWVDINSLFTYREILRRFIESYR